MSTGLSLDAARLPGQSLPWLQDFRADAWAQYVSTGLPTLRSEAWRYTSLAALQKKTFTAVTQTASTQAADYHSAQQLTDTWRVVIVNGQFEQSLSDLEGLPEGVCVMSMAEALAHHAELIQRHLGQAVAATEHGFIALNSAGFSDGVFVHVPAGTVLTKPLHCVHSVSQAEVMVNTRVLLLIEDHASLHWLESYSGVEAEYLSVAITEVFLAQHATLIAYKQQIEATCAYHFAGVYCKQAPYSHFTQHHFALGGILARSETHTELATAAECELNGLYLGEGRQHLDHLTRVTHAQSHSISREYYKGVLNERSRGVFQGRIIVEQQAQKTSSMMANRNLLLSEHAEADSKPQLEIYADDVKCSHGVTVGQLDEKSVFYLQSRGMDEASARNILIFAFANEMVEKITHRPLQAALLTAVLSRFPNVDIKHDGM
ncbi:MAG: Fe-S cluster assembly protein SufD [Methylovulum sp.]